MPMQTPLRRCLPIQFCLIQMLDKPGPTHRAKRRVSFLAVDVVVCDVPDSHAILAGSDSLLQAGSISLERVMN